MEWIENFGWSTKPEVNELDDIERIKAEREIAIKYWYKSIWENDNSS